MPRRNMTTTMRNTVVLRMRDQINHAAHLFFVIAASVIARNVANQQLLDSVGPQVLGKLYVAVALFAGSTLAALGWLGRNTDSQRVARNIHIGAATSMALAALLPTHWRAVAIGKYVVMEVAAAALLLAFGLILGARLGPREARKIAARVGAGGVVGGLFAGANLSLGAIFVGSRWLFLASAVYAILPVVLLHGESPSTTPAVSPASRKNKEVGSLAPYGRWVAVTTFFMVAATTLIDYQFRFAAAKWYDADELTAFFGFVVVLAGCTTILFQLTILDRLLDRLGIFATATVMPSALILCSAVFGLLPTLTTLTVLKLVDSGANMSIQQATGGLLLAPMSGRARTVWQTRIDGLAKRSGQVATGLFLAFFPLAPNRLLPLSLALCSLWLLAIVVTRSRYVRLLTDMLHTPSPNPTEVNVYDGATIRRLEQELIKANVQRARVILDLLEQAGHRAPEHILLRLAKDLPNNQGALLVIEHLADVGDDKTLRQFCWDADPLIASTALLELAAFAPDAAKEVAKKLVVQPQLSNRMRAMAAGILADNDDKALDFCRELAKAKESETRLAVAQALSHSQANAPPLVRETLCRLADDEDVRVARTAIEALVEHRSPKVTEVIVQALRRQTVRGTAMRALANLGPHVVQRIEQEMVVAAADPGALTALTWSLGKIASETSLPGLLRALKTDYVDVRLSASAALNSFQRKHPGEHFSDETLEQCCLSEINYYAKMRDVSLADLPKVAAAHVLQKAARQHGQASLETLFRLLSLRYPEEAIQGAFAGITSRDVRQRQLALELLDTLLQADLRQAINQALGEKQRAKKRDPVRILGELAVGPEKFLSGLAYAVLLQMEATPPPLKRAANAMSTTLVNQILELQSLPLFSQCSAEDLAEVAALVTARRINRGTILFREGDVADAMYLIKSGTITLTRMGQVVDKLGPGESCGIVAVLDRQPREMTATVSQDSLLLIIATDDLLQLLADRPLLMHSVFRALTGAIRSQIDKVALEKKSTSP